MTPPLPTDTGQTAPAMPQECPHCQCNWRVSPPANFDDLVMLPDAVTRFEPTNGYRCVNCKRDYRLPLSSAPRPSGDVAAKLGDCGYACPECGRSIPHGQDTHDFDQKLVLEVLGAAFMAIDHNAKRLVAEGNRDHAGWAVTAKRLRELIILLSDNPLPGKLAAEAHLKMIAP